MLKIQMLEEVHVKLGAQYKTTVTKDLNLHVGASLKLGNSLNSTGTENLIFSYL